MLFPSFFPQPRPRKSLKAGKVSGRNIKNLSEKLSQEQSITRGFVCLGLTTFRLIRGPARPPPNAPYMPSGAVLFFGSATE
jgi:hypothetical protein